MSAPITWKSIAADIPASPDVAMKPSVFSNTSPHRCCRTLLARSLLPLPAVKRLIRLPGEVPITSRKPRIHGLA